jgi:hypothetical protein
MKLSIRELQCCARVRKDLPINIRVPNIYSFLLGIHFMYWGSIHDVSRRLGFILVNIFLI